jgi:hypothetical protein
MKTFILIFFYTLTLMQSIDAAKSKKKLKN